MGNDVCATRGFFAGQQTRARKRLFHTLHPAMNTALRKPGNVVSVPGFPRFPLTLDPP